MFNCITYRRNILTGGFLMKKIVSLLIVCLMLGTTVFASTPSIWALEYVDEALKIGIIDSAMNYSYTMPINREDFCTLALNSLYKCGITKPEILGNPFDDTENKDVIELYGLGMINGKSATNFAPYENITREEAATILHRMCKLLGIEDVYDDYRLSSYSFVDMEEFSDWAKEHIYNVYFHGIMTGVGSDKFAPQAFYTTEQAVITIIRLYNKYTGQDAENNLFEDKLNAQMPKNKNYMFSPLSVKMALAIVANGADGETLDKILKVTDIENLDEFNAKSKDMIERYSEYDLLKLNIANSLWLNIDLTSQTYNKEYKKKVKECYYADAWTTDSSDFVPDVNGWVEEKTDGMITKIVDKPSYWAMVVNAIYFKGGWEFEFNESLTKTDMFTNADGTEVETDFMNQTNFFRYYENEGVKILALPYKNKFYSVNEDGEVLSEKSDLNINMYVLMSDYDIAATEVLNKALEEEKLNIKSYVKLSMPKFEISNSESLSGKLYDIGMKTPFGESADFRKMFDEGNMWIMDILHATYIKVDEKGTEAAAVTGVGMGGSSGRPPIPVEFKLNKPFAFIIRDDTNGEILFMGRYAFANK